MLYINKGRKSNKTLLRGCARCVGACVCVSVCVLVYWCVVCFLYYSLYTFPLKKIIFILFLFHSVCAHSVIQSKLSKHGIIKLKCPKEDTEYFNVSGKLLENFISTWGHKVVHLISVFKLRIEKNP